MTPCLSIISKVKYLQSDTKLYMFSMYKVREIFIIERRFYNGVNLIEVEIIFFLSLKNKIQWKKLSI